MKPTWTLVFSVALLLGATCGGGHKVVGRGRAHPDPAMRMVCAETAATAAEAGEHSDEILAALRLSCRS